MVQCLFPTIKNVNQEESKSRPARHTLTKISKYNLTDAIYQTKGKITLERKSRHKKASNFKALECAVVCAQKKFRTTISSGKTTNQPFSTEIVIPKFSSNFNFYEPP